MNDIVNVKKTLERKAIEFDASKELFAAEIRYGFKVARDKLDRAEKELLRKLDVYFSSNVYSEQIIELESKGSVSLEKAASVASIPVPTDFCPNEEAFGKLYSEIARLARKTILQPITSPPIPKNLLQKGLVKMILWWSIYIVVTNSPRSDQ